MSTRQAIPHRASFLQTFHMAAQIKPAPVADDEADLLDLVQETDEPTDLRSPRQIELMDKLVNDIRALDAEAGNAAERYTAGMTGAGKWTPGRDGNASDWIDRMITKVRDLRTARRAIAPTLTVTVPAGRYAIEDGEVKCYKVSHGREGSKWEGFVFLDRISTDNLFPIRNPAEKARILAEIAKDVEASEILAGLTLRQCRRCGRLLSDTKNPYFGVALGPECGGK